MRYQRRRVHTLAMCIPKKRKLRSEYNSVAMYSKHAKNCGVRQEVEMATVSSRTSAMMSTGAGVTRSLSATGAVLAPGVDVALGARVVPGEIVELGVDAAPGA